MMQLEGAFPVSLPDDPYKWDGWSKYKSPNLYERLCLDPRANPSNELIEQHCRELMRWWQKKLPLKNQPSNPLAQILRQGLDESSRYLTQARVELLDPERRRQVDSELAAQANEQAVIEFHKYLTFALVADFHRAGIRRHTGHEDEEPFRGGEQPHDDQGAQAPDAEALRHLAVQEPPTAEVEAGSHTEGDDEPGVQCP